MERAVKIIVLLLLVINFILNADTQKSMNSSCFFTNTENCKEECTSDEFCVRKFAGQSIYNSASTKEKEQNLSGAFGQFKFLADMTDLDYIFRTMAQWNVANMFQNGKGVDKDIGSSIKYYELSIKNGKKDRFWTKLGYFKDSYLQLYFLYQEDSPYKNMELSKKNLLEAAKQNYTLALNNLSVAFLEGKEGFKRNDKIALALLYYELKYGDWEFIEKYFGLDNKISFQDSANKRIIQLTSELTSSQIEESKKLSEDYDKLFRIAFKLSK